MTSATASHPAPGLTRSANPFARDVWSLFGMPLDNVTIAQACQQISDAVKNRERLSFVTPNVNLMVRALKEPKAMRQIAMSDLSLADGAPVVWLARQLGMPLIERCAGSDLFEALRQAPVETSVPIRVFFFGGSEGAGERAVETLRQEGGRIVPAGWYNPGFGDVASMSSDEVIETINAANPDFVIVSIGAAKGQDWIEANQHRLTAPVIAYLGAVVNFVAGSVNRAPAWVSRFGLEWIWRIVAEPSLWKRYWNDGVALLGFLFGRLGKAKKASRPSAVPTPFEVQADAIDDTLVLILKGDSDLQDRDLVAETFQAALQSAAIKLDLTNLGAAHTALLGQIRLLQKACIERDISLDITFPSADRFGLTPLISSENI